MPGVSEAGIPGHSPASNPNPRATVQFDAEKTPRLKMRFSYFAVSTPQLRHSAKSSNLAEYTGYAPTVPIIRAPPPARRRANIVTTIMAEQDGLFQDVGRVVTQLPTTSTERRIPTMAATTAASTYSQTTEITTAGLDLQRKSQSLSLLCFRLRSHGRIRCWSTSGTDGQYRAHR